MSVFDDVQGEAAPASKGNVFDQIEAENNKPGFFKRVAVGALTGLTAPIDFVQSLQPSPLPSTGIGEAPPPAPPQDSSLGGMIREATGVPEGQTFKEKAEDMFGALLPTTELSPFALLKHLYHAGAAAIGATAGGQVGKAVGGEKGEAIGTLAGALTSPALASKVGTGALEQMTKAETAAGKTAAGEALIEKPPTLPQTERQIRDEFEARQNAVSRQSFGDFEPSPGVMSYAESVDARQASAGLLHDLIDKSQNEFNGRFEKLEGKALGNVVPDDSRTALATAAKKMEDEASPFVSGKAKTFLREMQGLAPEEAQGPQTYSVGGQTLNIPAGATSGGVPVAQAAGAAPSTVTLKDLKDFRKRAGELAGSANAEDRTIGAQAKLLLLDTSIKHGLPRNAQLNAEYTLFNPDQKRQMMNDLRTIRDPSQMGPFLDPGTLGDVWKVASDTEKNGLRQTISQWAASTGKPLDTILKRYTNNQLDTFFDGAGKSGDMLRLKAATDDLPKLFEQQPDLKNKFLALARQNALEAYHPLSLPQGLTRRAMYAGSIAGGTALAGATGTIPAYAAGIAGLTGAAITGRMINKGVAMALESPAGLKLLSGPVRTGNTKQFLTNLAKLAGRATAYDAVRQQREQAGQNPQ